MKKQIFRIAFLFVSLSIFLCSCASSVEPEFFDADFLGTQSGIDLNGFEMIYEFGSANTSDGVDATLLGFLPDTNLADLARQRIADVEKQFNCKIKINVADLDTVGANLKMSALGGVFYCDVYSGLADSIANVARTGGLIGISELSDYIDYRDEEKWGPRSLLEIVYYNDDLYGVVPYAWPELTQTMFGHPIVVNEDHVASLGQPDPREFIENKTWTWDQFRKCLEAYTVIEGGQTVVYGFASHDSYYAEMFIRSNGSNLVRRGPNGKWISGFSDERAMKAMQEAVDIYYGDLAYTIDKTNAKAPREIITDFIDGKLAMATNHTSFIYGREGRISQNMSNFGILKWPVGPDVDPDHSFSILETNCYCIAFSAFSHSSDSTALIVNAMYEPLPGFETSDQIRDYMEHNYFFDERDCETFFDMYHNQSYNYFHYGIRSLVNEYFTGGTSISSVIERNEDKMQGMIDDYVVPSINGIEALWGTYDR